MAEEQLRLWPMSPTEERVRSHVSPHQPLGGGPDGATCGGCVHLKAHSWAAVHWKCEIYNKGSTVPGGYGGKRRKSDPACPKYSARE